MKNYPKWAKLLYNKYKSSISNTFTLCGNIGDYASGTKFLKDYLVSDFLFDEEMKMNNIYFYDLNSDGVCISNKGIQSSQEKFSFDKIMELIKDQNSRNVFIFSYPEYLFPSEYLNESDKKRIISFHSAINSYNYLASSNMVILITETTKTINQMFLSGNSRNDIINIELPDYSERLDFIQKTIDKSNIGTSMSITNETFARLTAGLQYIAIEDIVLLSSTLGYLDEKIVLSKKKEIIKKEFGEVIEIFDTHGFSLKDFAGQDNIKAYFKEVIIDNIKSANPEDKEIIPKGIMLMGPPGTGKTYFSRCLAGDAGINFIEFKISKILGKYVGESEKSMEKALSVFKALAPVGVFMDEIDQSFQRGNENSSTVSSNLFGMLLSEMAKNENRGEIIWLAATNYPNLVDEALKRPGRMDKKIPFFAPTDSERISVFKYHLNKTGFELNEDINCELLAEKTKGYTQAEIEGIIVKALELTKRAKLKKLNMEKILLALNYILSNQNEKVKEMEDIALKECNDQEFIPETYKERHKALMVSNNFGELNRSNNSR